MRTDGQLRVPRSTRRLLSRWVFGRLSARELRQVDPEGVLPIAFALGVEAHLLWRTRQMIAADVVQAAAVQAVLEALQDRCRYNAMSNLHTDIQARRLCERLAARGIPVMLLKGTALRARHPELSGRPQCDTDVLVPWSAVQSAEAVLESEGYVVDESRLTREEYLTQHFDLRMIRGGEAVELHWSMCNEGSPRAIDRTWERAERIDWAGTPVWLPSPEDQLVFTQLHLCRHSFTRGLRWIADLCFEAEHYPVQLGVLDTVGADWPARWLCATATVAAGYGLRGMAVPEPCPQLSSWEGALLRSICDAHLFNGTWCGVPVWRSEGVLAEWLGGEDRSLGWILGRALCRGGRRQLEKSWRHASW